MTDHEFVPPRRRTHAEATLATAPFRFGLHLAVDLLGCPPKRLGPTDPRVDALTARAESDELARFTRKLVDHIGMIPYRDVQIDHFGWANPVTAGYTVSLPGVTPEAHAAAAAGRRAVQLIETSLVAMHLSPAGPGMPDELVPPGGSAHVDVFSCQPFDALAALNMLERYFRPAETLHTVLVR